MYYKTNVKYTGRQQTKLGEQSIVYIDNSWKSVYTQNQGTKDAKKEKNYGWALDSARKNPYNSRVAHPGVAQLVARMVRDHEAVGSNPATRTIKSYRYRCVWRKARRINRFRAFFAQNSFYGAKDVKEDFGPSAQIRTGVFQIRGEYLRAAPFLNEQFLNCPLSSRQSKK